MTKEEFLEKLRPKPYLLTAEKYDFEKETIKIYLHYAPTTYHLHVHFVLVSNTDVNSSIEYSHDLTNVIYNLKINSNYYQIITMNKRI